MEDSFNPEQEQEDELVALESIFMHEFVRLEPEALSSRRKLRRLQLTILPFPNEQELNFSSLRMEVTLPDTYPIILPRLKARASDVRSDELGLRMSSRKRER